MKKTVIFPWGGKWDGGIGDLVRGSYGLYLVCKNKYNFLIDISNHMISEYLEVKPNIYSDIIKNDQGEFYFSSSKEELESLLEKFLENKDITCISANCCFWVYDTKMEEGFTNMIKEILTPKAELKTLIDEAKFNLGSYSCLHMRLGDDYKLHKLNILKYSTNIILEMIYSFPITRISKDISRRRFPELKCWKHLLLI